jgi:hypothetical protein
MSIKRPLGARSAPNQKLRNDEGLTRRQAQFIEDFMRDPDATLSGVGNGNDAHKILAQPHVMVSIAKRTAGLDVSPQEIVDNIVRISDKAETAGMFMAALKGQELLGKYKGMWVEKHVNLNIDMAREHVTALVDKMRRRRERGEYVPHGNEILHIAPPSGPFVSLDPFDGF